ncbi:MAG: TadE family protein [Ilumatobacter sp.]|uniref:TadE/TadG family type IV pilus assembly protein n=1 Tax=Ilumatobacter sp. TaxID=1967498 RepID=UPI00329844D0
MARPDPEPRSTRARLGSERGEVATLLIVFGVVVLAIFGCVHASLVFHGRSVVSAAAQDALRAVQAEGGSLADGYDAAEETLALSPGLEDTSVVITPGNDVNRVRVTATVRTPLGGFFTTVSADVEGPKERFYSEAERE